MNRHANRLKVGHFSKENVCEMLEYVDSAFVV